MARYFAKLDLEKEFEAAFSLPLFTGDSGNTVALEFFAGGVPCDLTGAQIYARRPDGTVLTTSSVASGNQVQFTLYNNMFSYLVELQVQVSIVDAYGNFLTSGVLYFTVKEGFSSQAQGEGTDDFCDLTALIRQVGQGIGQIERAEQIANLSEGLNAEMQAFLKQYENISDQVIVNLSEEDLDDFFQGAALVSISQIDDENGINRNYKCLVLSEHENDLSYLTVTQTRFFNGSIQKRTGVGVSSHPLTWTSWSDMGANTVDLIFDGNTDLSSYHGQTISNKTIFLKTHQTADRVIHINFTNCIIYGNKKWFGTWGNINFNNCEIYDLHSNGQSGQDEEGNIHYGNFGFIECRISGGSASSYYDPNLSNTKCFNVSISGAYYACYASGCVFEGCDFYNQPYNSSPGTNNSFIGCSFSGGSSTMNGGCYFSGCSGEVVVSNDATVKPSTTTAFQDHNFATITIQ